MSFITTLFINFQFFFSEEPPTQYKLNLQLSLNSVLKKARTLETLITVLSQDMIRRQRENLKCVKKFKYNKILKTYFPKNWNKSFQKMKKLRGYKISLILLATFLVRNNEFLVTHRHWVHTLCWSESFPEHIQLLSDRQHNFTHENFAHHPITHNPVFKF